MFVCKFHILYWLYSINLPVSVLPQPVATTAVGVKEWFVLRQMGRTYDEKPTSFSKRNNAISL